MPSAITVENLGKAYRLGLKEEIPDTLVGAATSWMKAPMRNFHRLRRLNTFSARSDEEEEDIVWALRDVSFEVAEGEVLGIIGRNGAGKSTLLKILSRITEPTTGRATIRGRVSSLLEVGTGFHPELSGRENIYMNGTILGMTKREIDQKFDEIVDFSGVERFLDTPIKRYSSGMKVRLAFSVAAHLEPEILIIDEVLAVGDAEFQRRCLGKMQNVASGGRTVLYVSHQLASVESLCSRAILMDSGTIKKDASPKACIEEYLNASREAIGSQKQTSSSARTSSGPHIKHLRVVNSAGVEGFQIGCLESFSFKVIIGNPTGIECPHCAINVSNTKGQTIFRLYTANTEYHAKPMQSDFFMKAEVEQCPLMPGEYAVRVYLCNGTGNVVDEFECPLGMQVLPRPIPGLISIPNQQYNLVCVPSSWSIRSSSTLENMYY